MLFQMTLKKAAQTVSGMIISGTATAGQIRFNVGATFAAGGDVGATGIGPYAVSLPPTSPMNGAAPNSTDAAGNVTINNLISAGGADIVIPGSITYVVSAPIVIPSGKTIRAATGTSVTIKASAGYTSPIITMTNAVGSAVKNITIDGNWTQRSAQEGVTSAASITINGGSAITVEQCLFTNTPSFGILDSATRALTIQYNTFNEVYAPIKIDGNNLSDTGAVTGNTFNNTVAFKSLQALEAKGTRNLSVMHNTFSGTGVLNPVSHGTSGTWGNSIYITSSDATLVENNTCNPAYWSSCVLGAGVTTAVVKRNYFSKGLSASAVSNTNSFWNNQTSANISLIQRNIFEGGLVVGGNHATIEDNTINVYGPPAAGFEFGVNVHEGGSSTASNIAIINTMQARGLRHVRMDLFLAPGNQALVTDFITRCVAVGINVQGIPVVRAQNGDHTIYTGAALTTWKADNSADAKVILDRYFPMGVRDYEVLNEVPLRSECAAQVPDGPSANWNEAAYTGKTAYISIAAACRGVADAIHAKSPTCRAILGTVGWQWGYLKYMTTLGVVWDVLGYHRYPGYSEASWLTDTRYGPGGIFTQLGSFNRPITLNEFNAGEIYGYFPPGVYTNVEGAAAVEDGFSSNIKYLREMRDQTTCNIESVVWYQLYDQPTWGNPEGVFGLMYDATTPKVSLFIASAFAGGSLSAAEITKLTTRGMTTTEINAMQPLSAGVGLYASETFNQGTIQRNTFNKVTGPDNGVFLWDKNTSNGPVSLSVINNIFNGFTNGVLINNSASIGNVTGLTISGNSFSACTTNIKIITALSVNFATSTIQGFGASASAGASGYLFASRTDFPTGYGRGLKPTNYTNGQMDTAIRTQFNAWKAARINGPFTVTGGTQSVYGAVPVTGCYYDQFSSATKSYVSEGQGYAALIFVIMAGYDANARTIFDGIFKLGRARPAFGQINTVSPSAKYLMEWYANPDLTSPNDGYNAADGDLDMALALLMADRQWGSTGAINYFQEALNTIGALKAVNFTSVAGNTTGVPLINASGFRFAARTSDFMYDHFRQFALATGDTFWNTGITNCQTLITNIISGYAASSHLTPDWIVDTTTTPIPSPAGVSPDHSGHDGEYYYNACRNPWRFGTHYLMTGNATSRLQADNHTLTIMSESLGNPDSIANYYLLNGTGVAPRQRNIAFGHALAVGAMGGLNANDQIWLNSFMTTFTNNVITGYFDSELMLLAMIVMSGNWWGRY